MERRWIYTLVCLLAWVGVGSKAIAQQIREMVPAVMNDSARKANYLFLQATDAYTLGHRTDALFMLKRSVALNPKEPAALMMLGEIYAGMDSLEKAVALQSEAVKLSPENKYYSLQLLNNLLSEGDVDKILSEMEKMSRKFPHDLSLLFQFSSIYEGLNEVDEAIQTLQEVCKLQPSSDLYMRMARMYANKGEENKAIDLLQGELKKEPGNCDLMQSLIFYLLRKNVDEAGKLLDRSDSIGCQGNSYLVNRLIYYENKKEQKKYNATVLMLMANPEITTDFKEGLIKSVLVPSLSKSGDTTLVINSYKKAIEAAPQDTILPTQYAAFLMQLNNPKYDDDLINALYDFLKYNKDNRVGRLILLSKLVNKEDTVAVNRLCREGMENDPQELRYPMYLASSFSMQGKHQEALKVLQRAFPYINESEETDIVSLLYSLKGDLLYKLDKKKEAYAAYDSSLLYKPDNLETLNNYAYFLSVDQKNLNKAEKMSLKTVLAEPHNTIYLDTYAWILFEKKEYQKAKLYIDEAMKNKSELTPDIIEHCGDIYAKLGLTEKAVEYWKQAKEAGGDGASLELKIKKRKYVK